MQKNKIGLILIGIVIGLCVPSGMKGMPIEDERAGMSKPSRAWEIGIGASVFQFSRVDFTRFQPSGDNYQLGMQLRHSVLGPGLYIARELNPYFYLDLQGTVGFTAQYMDGENRQRNLYMVGPGVQWRLGEHFESRYIDPFVRVGVNYLKKNFDMKYQGSEGDLPEEMSWVLENLYNKDGMDRDEMLPVSLGIGMNTWLNDRFGIGLQGDYLLMPYQDVANSLQGTVRLIWRVGGKSKKPIQRVEYVEIEKIVQAPPITVEKIVEVLVPSEEDSFEEICELFNNIYFAFDKSDIRAESEEVLDKLASIINANSDRHYLITGHTDARGSAEYNFALSQRRAAAVVDALESRGVPTTILKSRGVGKKISFAPVLETHAVREGDRKVTIEIITNMEYWNILPNRDF